MPKVYGKTLLVVFAAFKSLVSSFFDKTSLVSSFLSWTSCKIYDYVSFVFFFLWINVSLFSLEVIIHHIETPKSRCICLQSSIQLKSLSSAVEVVLCFSGTMQQERTQNKDFLHKGQSKDQNKSTTILIIYWASVESIHSGLCFFFFFNKLKLRSTSWLCHNIK